MKVPTTFTSRILRNKSTGVSSVCTSAAMPAELTTPSRPPSASTTCANTRTAAVSSVTSSGASSTPFAAASSLRAGSSVDSSRSTMATFHPDFSSCFAVAKPMPDAPPVISATLSAMLFPRPSRPVLRQAQHWVATGFTLQP
jgi:hypothetical protein